MLLAGRVVDVQVSEPLPTAADAHNLAIVFGAAVNDFLDHGVKAGNIASSG